MQILVRNIRLPVQSAPEEASEQALKRLAPLFAEKDILRTSLYRRSVDARRGEIYYVYTVLAETVLAPDEARLTALDCAPLCESMPAVTPTGEEPMEERPLIVGFGPCGMFCAMLLAEYGYRPVVIERGSEIETRKRRVADFCRTGILDPECNVQFGAGGAGTFSDGKLVTRINDPKTRYVLEKLHELGAPDSILLEAKPHIGTDRLETVVQNAEKRLKALGGELRYDTRLERIENAGTRRMKAVTSNGEIACSALILAIGHSARDTYTSLMGSGFGLSPKPFSVGVRIEHLQSDIDRALYGKSAGKFGRGHAEYALSRRYGERGVYSFCMCPGGTVVAAASEEGGVVTNGMSNYARSGINANAAIAVSVSPDEPMEFQRRLERAAFAAGGGGYAAPCQTLGDFFEGKLSREPKRIMPTYPRGVKIADFNRIFPSDISKLLKDGIRAFGRSIPGFDSADIPLTGVETRTSAPYRINRNAAFVAVDFPNVYPCGEGAGYAGGITSAAVDGLNTAIEIMKRYRAGN